MHDLGEGWRASGGQGKLPWTPVVRGNIDGGPLRFLPLTDTWQGNGRTVALLHIAGNPRRPHKDARRLIEDTHPDVLLVGHSHLFVVGRVGTTLWINPGAAGRHGFHDQRTAAFLHIDPDGTLHLERINLGPRALLTRGPTQDEPCEL
jgi:predicted phosphodiesterase